MPSKAEFHRQYVAARKAGARARRTEPRIVSAKCAARVRLLEVAFTNGVTILFPIKWFPDLRRATRRAINRCEVDEGGMGLHWEELDADYSAETLVRSAGMMPPPTFKRPRRRPVTPES